MSLLFLIAVSAAGAPVSTDPNKVFKVAGRTFVGITAKVCDIEGKWSDGEYFRYRAWDSCKKMSIERVAPKRSPEVIEQRHGKDKTFVIPAGSEGFRLSNESSAVWVFRNAAGEMEEILISD